MITSPKIRQLFASTACLFILSSCAGMPLSTMWKMRNFGLEDFIATNPEELSIAVTLPSEKLLTADEILFCSSLIYEDPELNRYFRMPVENTYTGDYIPGLPKAKTDYHWQEFQLTPEGKASLREYQQLIPLDKESAEAAGATGTTFTVDIDPDKQIEYSDDELRFSIGLQLDREQGYLLLFKNRTLTFNEEDPEETQEKPSDSEPSQPNNCSLLEATDKERTGAEEEPDTTADI